MSRVEPEHFDVLIVGAGISGIAAAYHLQTRCPSKSYAILEGRDVLGGTWDLFRYPGIRSDSDMYTLGFSFRPWKDPKAIADGPSILAYLHETAEAYGIDEKIRYGHQLKRAAWSSDEARWEVELEVDGEPRRMSCGFLYMCVGYYRYDRGFTPAFEGLERFEGELVHPQAWPEDLDHAGQRVVVIGSGATAVTLVPALAKSAEHVTMLQRSPTYIVSAPEDDPVADWLRDHLPEKPAYALARWKNVLTGMALYQFARRFPDKTRQVIFERVERAVGDDCDAARHFTPKYDPWDQRLCLVPRGDLFKAIRRGDASVVTDEIEAFTSKGIRLVSGEELEADLIVTATGLDLLFLGGVDFEVDGEPIDPSKRLAYKGMMLSDVPNLAVALGYTNASWTLKCELTSEYVCRLLQHMDTHGYDECTPLRADPSIVEEPLLDFSAGYVMRTRDRFPRQGSASPWKLYQNYVLDLLALRRAPLEDGVMAFSARHQMKGRAR